MKRTPLKRTPFKPKAKKKKSDTPSIAMLDTVFSLYIRRHGSCQLHGYGDVVCSNQLDCSHIKSRKYMSVRWDIGNAIASCKAHHFWQHAQPDQSTFALLEILGREHLDQLQLRFREGKKPTPDEKREIYRWLKEHMTDSAS